MDVFVMFAPSVLGAVLGYLLSSKGKRKSYEVEFRICFSRHSNDDYGQAS